MMKRSIGILGGMGPLATVDLMRKIILLTEAEKDGEHIRIYVDDNPQIPDRTAAILHGGESPLPQMRESLQKLQQCGADCIIMPCNTAHYFLPQLQAETETPFLSMLAETARACARKYPGKRAAILATTGTIASGIYTRALEAEGISALLPDKDEQKLLMHLIYEVVKASAPLEPERENWRRLLEGMQIRGADYFILGCTELPILAEALESTSIFIDPTEELAKAAIRYAGYKCTKSETTNA